MTQSFGRLFFFFLQTQTMRSLGARLRLILQRGKGNLYSTYTNIQYLLSRYVSEGIYKSKHTSKAQERDQCIRDRGAITKVIVRHSTSSIHNGIPTLAGKEMTKP